MSVSKITFTCKPISENWDVVVQPVIKAGWECMEELGREAAIAEIDFTQPPERFEEPADLKPQTDKCNLDYGIEYDGADFIVCIQGQKGRLPDKAFVHFILLSIFNQGNSLSDLEIWKTFRPPEDIEEFKRMLKSGEAIGFDKVDISTIKKAEGREKACIEALNVALENGDADSIELKEELEGIQKFLKHNRRKDGYPRKTSTIFDSARASVYRERRKFFKFLKTRNKGFREALLEHLKYNLVRDKDTPGHFIYNPSPEINWVTKNIPENLLKPIKFQK